MGRLPKARLAILGIRSPVDAVPMEQEDRPPLSVDDVAILRELVSKVPEAFSRIDSDTVIAFVRSYANYKPRLETTAKHMRDVLEWRDRLAYDPSASLSSPLQSRPEFERLYQAGPVGRDACGRAVVVERIGAIPAKEFCAKFSAEEVLQHSVYNREAALALNRSLSHQEGRLIQRITPFVDLKGLGWEHLSRDFLHRTKMTITTLLHSYPDATSGFYVVNAPSLFTVLWKCIRPLLDEETAKMVQVLGGPTSYAPVLERMGVVLSEPGASLETCHASWSNAMREVAPLGRKPPPWLHPADRHALQAALSSADLDASHLSTSVGRMTPSDGKEPMASRLPSAGELIRRRSGRASPSSVLVRSLTRGLTNGSNSASTGSEASKASVAKLSAADDAHLTRPSEDLRRTGERSPQEEEPSRKGFGVSTLAFTAVGCAAVFALLGK